jgi:hypothetical protein
MCHEAGGGVAKLGSICNLYLTLNRVEPHLSGFIGMAKYPDMQKIRVIVFFFESRLHWQFEFRLLLFTVCTCV